MHRGSQEYSLSPERGQQSIRVVKKPCGAPKLTIYPSEKYGAANGDSPLLATFYLRAELL